MQVRLSVVAPGAREPVDVTIAVAPGTRLGEVADQLRAAAIPPPTGGAADEPTHHDLFLDGARLADDALVGSPPLVHGALVTVGAPGHVTMKRGLLQLRVVGGPDAGGVHQLGPGTLRIGRAPTVDIRIDDAELSRAHAELEVSWTTVTVRDLASTNGTTVDGVPVGDDGVELPVGTVLRVGASALVLAMPELHRPITRPDSKGHLEVNRPPRLEPARQTADIVFPAGSDRGDRPRFPIAAALVPLVLACAMVVLLRRVEFAALALLSPLMVAGQWLADRQTHRRRDRTARAAHTGALAEARDRLDSAVAEEQQAARAAAPDPAQVLLTAVQATPQLWHRRRSDHDALMVRLGLADLPAQVRITGTGSDRAPDLPSPPRLHDVPVTIPLRRVGVLGLAGPRRSVLGLARAVVGQLAVHHCCRDLSMVVLTTDERSPDWSWTRWLPHLAPTAGQDCMARQGTDDTQRHARVQELLAELDARTAGSAAASPYTVVVIDEARPLRTVPGLARLLAEGPDAAITALCIADSMQDLPVECRARAVVSGAAAATLRVEVEGGPHVPDVAIDAVSASWAERVSRALAPLREATPDDEERGLPASTRLLDLLAAHPAAGPPSPREVADAWRRSSRSTSAVLGECVHGAYTVDLCRDGPHTLIAGTTGSGKSELLQTLVASLAVANRPDGMQFVLIDYKGGAAFADLARLPHTAGLVTDLDGHLTERALLSLGAELKRRETALRAAGVTDIEGYHSNSAMQVGEPAHGPLPRLLIVVDEFATLVEELPGFVDGLVGVARRGRSLGVHLVLATQRPAGIVTADIRSNTSLRIALRVTDAQDSLDVIDTADAAAISRMVPGRAIARAGAEAPIVFQTARVAGERPQLVPGPRVEPLPWRRLGDPPRPRLERGASSGRGGTSDLSCLVDALRTAAELVDVRGCPSPWLPPLPASVPIADLPEADVSEQPPGGLPPLPFALLDVPAAQARRSLSLDLSHGSHLLVVGGPRSGRSTLLRTLAAQVAVMTSGAEVHIYGLDCGNGALRVIAELPHCGAVAAADQPERVWRLLSRLTDEVHRRLDLLGGHGHSDITEQRRHADAADRLPYLLVLIDRWEGFLGALDEMDGGRLTDAVVGLLRDGPAAGLRAVVTGDRSALLGRIGSLIPDTLVLGLPDPADAALAGLHRGQLPRDQPPGRAVVATTGLEAQIAHPGTEPSGAGQASHLADVAAQARARDQAIVGPRKPFPVEPLPDRVDHDALSFPPPPPTSPLWVPVGVGGDDAALVGVDLRVHGPALVVTGPPGSGRSTALVTMTTSLLQRGVHVIAVTPRQSPLRSVAGCEALLRGFTGAPGDETTLSALVSAARDPLVVVVDDAELLLDAPLGTALHHYLHSCRDGDRALLIAGTGDGLQAGFRGLAADARKSRTGLLLSPDGPLVGDLLGVRLPRWLTAPHPPGRGVLVTRGTTQAVQVPTLPESRPVPVTVPVP